MALTQEDLQAIGALMDSKLEPIDNRLDKLEQGQVELKQGQAELKQDVKKLTDTTAKIEKVHGQKINGMFESIVGAGEKFSRLDLVEGKVEDHEHRLFAVEETLKKAE